MLRHEPLIILTVLVAPCGCSEGGSSQSGAAEPTTQAAEPTTQAAEPTTQAAEPTTQAAEDEWHRYDDPRYSADERKAVRAATEAVLGPNHPRPDFDQAFRYWVSKYQGDWVVTVWRVYGFKDGKPQFVPGGFTDVFLDKDFKVKSTMPGK